MFKLYQEKLQKHKVAPTKVALQKVAPTKSCTNIKFHQNPQKLHYKKFASTESCTGAPTESNTPHQKLHQRKVAQQSQQKQSQQQKVAPTKCGTKVKQSCTLTKLHQKRNFKVVMVIVLTFSSTDVKLK